MRHGLIYGELMNQSLARFTFRCMLGLSEDMVVQTEGLSEDVVVQRDCLRMWSCRGTVWLWSCRQGDCLKRWSCRGAGGHGSTN